MVPEKAVVAASEAFGKKRQQIHDIHVIVGNTQNELVHTVIGLRAHTDCCVDLNKTENKFIHFNMVNVCVKQC